MSKDVDARLARLHVPPHLRVRAAAVAAAKVNDEQPSQPQEQADSVLPSYCRVELGELRKLLAAVGKVKSKHAAYYLLRSTANVAKVVYLAKACPRESIHGILVDFDAGLRAAVEDLVGSTLSEQQWQQASLPGI